MASEEGPRVASAAAELTTVLEHAGYLPVGTPVRLKTDDPSREWMVSGLVVEVFDPANMSVSYRVWHHNATSQHWRTVPAVGVEPIHDDAPQPVVIHEPTSASEPSAGGLVWESAGDNIVRTTCGRFEIRWASTIDMRPIICRDLWTIEQAEHVYTVSGAKHWCEHRTKPPALEWAETTEDSLACLVSGPFAIYDEADSTFWAEDSRFSEESWRCSPDFTTQTEAKHWCAVRAACAAHPDAPPGERLVYQYAPEVAAQIPF